MQKRSAMAIAKFVALIAMAMVSLSQAGEQEARPAYKDPRSLEQIQKGQISRECIRAYREDFDGGFKSNSKMVLPDCYNYPENSFALNQLKKILRDNPKESRNIAMILRSWTDVRESCLVKETAYAPAVEEIISYINGEIPLKEASSGRYEGRCGRRESDVTHPYTTTCETNGNTTTCKSSGGGLPRSQMVCRSNGTSSTCTFSEQ